MNRKGAKSAKSAKNQKNWTIRVVFMPFVSSWSILLFFFASFALFAPLRFYRCVRKGLG